MLDGFHIPLWNRTKKPLAIALSRVGRGLKGRDDGDDVTNVQFKSSLNCRYESPLYNEYILIKIILKIHSAGMIGYPYAENKIKSLLHAT
jgi:hypothetical protein